MFGRPAIWSSFVAEAMRWLRGEEEGKEISPEKTHVQEREPVETKEPLQKAEEAKDHVTSSSVGRIRITTVCCAVRP